MNSTVNLGFPGESDLVTAFKFLPVDPEVAGSIPVRVAAFKHCDLRFQTVTR